MAGANKELTHTIFNLAGFFCVVAFVAVLPVMGAISRKKPGIKLDAMMDKIFVSCCVFLVLGVMAQMMFKFIPNGGEGVQVLWFLAFVGLLIAGMILGFFWHYLEFQWKKDEVNRKP